MARLVVLIAVLAFVALSKGAIDCNVADDDKTVCSHKIIVYSKNKKQKTKNKKTHNNNNNKKNKLLLTTLLFTGLWILWYHPIPMRGSRLLLGPREPQPQQPPLVLPLPYPSPPSYPRPSPLFELRSSSCSY